MLKCTKLLTTQAQYETVFTGAFGSLVQHTLVNSFHCNSISFIGTSRVTNIPTVLRREKPVSELSLIGKETLHRAQPEAKHLFCGDYSEVVSGAPVINSFHDMITSQIDIQTIRSQHMSAE